ncbi:MAG: efflux RND transporter periplasmic adaptor subunit [Sulfurimonas sp.]|nr:efflux RND transporter periplasmic adaptor subunit [Sulfurimonas sp.]MDD3059511.1 efflux RND transporter periplasmic adaptor subunit [Sulfurimonas sp.]MDD5202941.1 efflux RND transporter periplasmic adaptor subunit [Sulfurimonas sp.]
MQNSYQESLDISKQLEKEGKKVEIKKWLIVAIIFVGMIALGAYFMTTAGKNEKIKYLTAAIEKKDLLVKVSATGNIEPTNTVDVGIEVSGTIIEVGADFNQQVKRGDILARLDTTKLESKVKNSQAALLVAKANFLEKKISLEDTRNELERGKTTYKSTSGKYPSDKDLDALTNNHERALANYAASEAGVTQVRAQLKSDEDDLKKAVVKSPINGIVLDKKVEVGQSVVSVMQIPVLFTLAEDLSKMQVVLSVDEADIGQVAEGQNVEFFVDAYPHEQFQGKITQVRLNSIIVSGVVTYATVVAVDNPRLLLKPGMTTSADIVTEVVKNRLSVPNSALRFTPKDEKKDEKNQGKQVWILENNLPKSLSVAAQKSDGIFTAISGEGIKEGMQVIIGTQKEQ